MPKGQSAVLEYVIFFTIGIFLFIGLGNVFLSHYNSLNKDLSFSNAMLLNSFVASQAIYLSNQCKQCQIINQSLIMPNTTRTFQAILNSSGLLVQNPLTNVYYSSSLHNLNSTLSLDGSGFFAKRLTLTYDKIINNLEIK